MTQTLLKSLPTAHHDIFWNVSPPGSLIIKRSFISSIPFYIVLGVMFYINIFSIGERCAAVDPLFRIQDWT